MVRFRSPGVSWYWAWSLHGMYVVLEGKNCPSNIEKGGRESHYFCLQHTWSSGRNFF